MAFRYWSVHARSRSHPAQAPVNYYALVWALIPIMTIVGNALVVLSVVRERALQSVTNYFIVSLAVSDFIVASFVMPFGVYTEVRINCFSIYLCPFRASFWFQRYPFDNFVS